MSKITLFLATALCMALELVSFSAKAAQEVVFEEKFLTNPIVEDDNWGFSAGTTCTYNEVNQSMEVRWTTKPSTSTKTLSEIISAGDDGIVTIEFIFKAVGTFDTDASYLYFMDSNGNAITGLYFGRNKINNVTYNHIARVLAYTDGSYVKESRDANNQLLVNNPTAKVTIIIDFKNKKYSFTAQAGSYDYEAREFDASGPVVTSSDNTFINEAAANIGALISKANKYTAPAGFDLMYLGISADAPGGPTGISSPVVDKTAVSSSYYDLVGKKVTGNEKGIIIKKTVYSDGSVETNKIVNK